MSSRSPVLNVAGTPGGMVETVEPIPQIPRFHGGMSPDQWRIAISGTPLKVPDLPAICRKVPEGSVCAPALGEDYGDQAVHALGVGRGKGEEEIGYSGSLFGHRGRGALRRYGAMA